MPRIHNLFQRGSIHILTFSGAHGVGKSTLIAEMQALLREVMEGGKPDLFDDGAELLEGYDHKCLTQFMVPSCSTAWFKQTQEALKAQGKPFPVTYDDINAMGLRAQMQAELPGILAMKLHVAVNEARMNGGGIVFVDRWFGDIAAYSQLELNAEQLKVVTDSMEEDYQATMMDLVGHAADNALDISLSHIYVPVSACEHQMPLGKTVDKAHRGSTPQAEWEEAYASANRYTDPQRTVILTAKNRLQRVAEVFVNCFD